MQSSTSASSTIANTINSSSSAKLKFCDIGANLLDERFTMGVYRGAYRHEPDLDDVMGRAKQHGVCRIVLTAGTVEESRKAVEMARDWNQKYGTTTGIIFTSTVGVHPTRCQQVFEPDSSQDDGGGDSEGGEALLDELLEIARDGMKDGTVSAIGEIGLDYERLQFCPMNVQKRWLRLQLERVAKPTGLPLFLHNRNVGTDLHNMLNEHADCWKDAGGVVHSFDDKIELANMFINGLGLYIGLNGCSLRTEDNMEVVRQLPLERILLETDCPYCDVRRTHAGYRHVQTHIDAKAEKKFKRGYAVKNRQEPGHVIQVAEAIAGCKQLPLQQVADTCYQNTLRVFGFDK